MVCISETNNDSGKMSHTKVIYYWKKNSEILLTLHAWVWDQIVTFSSTVYSSCDRWGNPNDRNC